MDFFDLRKLRIPLLTVLMFILISSLFFVENKSDTDYFLHTILARQIFEGGINVDLDFTPFYLVPWNEIIFNHFRLYHFTLGVLQDSFGVEWGMKMMVIIFFAGAVLVWFLGILQLQKKLDYIIALILCNFYLFYRTTFDRAQPLMFFILTLWIYSFHTSRWIIAFLIGLLIPYTHGVLFVVSIGGFLLLIIHKFYYLFNSLKRKVLLATFLGSLLGLILHPDKHNFFNFVSIQVFQLLFKNYGFTNWEWEYMEMTHYLIFYAPLILFWFSTLVLTYIKSSKNFINTWYHLIISGFFFLLFFINRASEIAVPIIVYCLYVYSRDNWRNFETTMKYLYQQSDFFKIAKKIILVFILLWACGSIFLVTLTLIGDRINELGIPTSLGRTIPRDLFLKEVSFIKENIPEGSKIFHVSPFDGNILWFYLGNRYKLIHTFDIQFLFSTSRFLGDLHSKIYFSDASTACVKKYFDSNYIINYGPKNNIIGTKLANEGIYSILFETDHSQIWGLKDEFKSKSLSEFDCNYLPTT